MDTFPILSMHGNSFYFVGHASDGLYSVQEVSINATNSRFSYFTSSSKMTIICKETKKVHGETPE